MTTILPSHEMSARGEGPARGPLPSVHAVKRVQGARVDGKFLTVNGERYWVKGVTYGTFKLNSAGEPFPEFDQMKADFAAMRAAGINTVRLYTPPSDRVADAAADAGLHIMADIMWGPRVCKQFEMPEQRAMIRDYVRGHARRLAGHPAMLLWSIGNEIPPLVVRWYGRDFIREHLREMTEIIKEQAPEALVTYANHPPCEHLSLPFLDVVSFNVYLERELDFRKYLARLQSLAGERPVLVSELGLDSARNGEAKQAAYLDQFIHAAFQKGVCGTMVYAWTDEWSVFAHDVNDWAFGLTNFDRTEKLSTAAVRRVYSHSLYDLRPTPWPRVSVVVCSYNGGKTLARCIRSLLRLNYPNYEIIIVDDGSKDLTRQICARYPVRAIHVPNGGLSRARNLGIDAATGSVVAFIDSDAFADPDWLYFMVTTLEEQKAAGVGGPNLTPVKDGFTAHCVDHAPGNPTHVLLDDETAEHVPGCNMAFLKSALDRVGKFDPTHRAAGDDVDVCWKLIAAREKIAFAPTAVVWHHRRPTVRAFLKQQEGYGHAESFLARRYPSRFNFFGDMVWHGSIYDGAHAGLRTEGLPRIFKPRVYHGPFCTASYQGVYHPFRTWWFQVFTTAEWQATGALVALAAAAAGLCRAWLPMAGLAFFALAMLGVTLAAAWTSACHAAQLKRWRDKAFRGKLIVAALHVLQPLARARGRVRGWWHSRKEPHVFPATDRLYGNMDRRHYWLENLQAQLSAGGWQVVPPTEWDAHDVHIAGPGPVRGTLTSVVEEVLERGNHYVRYKIDVRWKSGHVFAALAVAAGAAGASVLAPYLLPLTLPVAGWVVLVARAKAHMIRAVSQACHDAGRPLYMSRVEWVE